MILFDYWCSNCETTFEDWEESSSSTEAHMCPHCRNKKCKAVPGGHIDWIGMGVDPAFTTSGDKWANMHEREAKKEPRD